MHRNTISSDAYTAELGFGTVAGGMKLRGWSPSIRLQFLLAVPLAVQALPASLLAKRVTQSCGQVTSACLASPVACMSLS